MNRFSNHDTLFQEHVEYPAMWEVAEAAIPQDTMYGYVSSSFLNGLVNYIGAFKAYYLHRYRDGDYSDAGDVWVELSKAPHSHYGSLKDDVVLLGETPNSYWLLWYDQDCSDCFIGRVRKYQFSDRDGFARRTEKQLLEFGVRGWDLLPAPSGWVSG